MMVVVAKRPSIDGEMRGQFDDVLGIQLLRNRFALLAMEAAEKSVQSPIVVPGDVQEIEFGGDAIIRTNNLITGIVYFVGIFPLLLSSLPFHCANICLWKITA